MHREVKQTKSRSGWPASRQTCWALGIARLSYYRWLKEEAWPAEAPRLAPRYETLSEEQQAVLADASRRPTPRHRELA